MRNYFRCFLLCCCPFFVEAQPSWLYRDVLSAEYVVAVDDQMLQYTVNGRKGFMDNAGKILSPPNYMITSALGGGWFGFQDPTTQKWGVADRQGVAKLQPTYYRISAFGDGYAVVQWSQYNAQKGYTESLWNLLDTNLKEVFPKPFNQLEAPAEGLCAFKQDSLWGFVALNGKVAIPPTFYTAKSFGGDLAPAQNKKKLWGYINKKGDWVIEPQYTDAEPFQGNLASVAKNGFIKERRNDKQWGLIDRGGKLVVPMNYDMAFNEDAGLRRMQMGDKMHLYNGKGELITPEPLDNVEFESEGMIRFKERGFTGYMDASGKVVIPAQFEWGGEFLNGLALVSTKSLWGYVDKSGKMAIPCTFEMAYPFRYGRAVVIDKGERCVIDNAGKIILRTGAGLGNHVLTPTHIIFSPGKRFLLLNTDLGLERLLTAYDEIGEFRDSLAAVKKVGKYGFINTRGEEVIKAEYKQIGEFYDGVAAAIGNNSTVNFIDKNGVKVCSIPEGYRYGGSFSGGMAKVASAQGLFGFINKKGELVVPTKYAKVFDFINGFAVAVGTDKKYGLLDKTGKEVVPLMYDECGDMSAEGLLAARQLDKWGYIDKNGKTMIPFDYEVVGVFSNGIAPVKKNGKVGYIDTKGKEVVPLMFEDGKEFLEDLAAVKLNGKWGFANPKDKGKLVIEAQYDMVTAFSENLSWVKKDGKVGCINKKGETVVPFDYEDAGVFASGLAYVQKGGKKGIVNKLGKEVLPTVFDKIGNIVDNKVMVLLSTTNTYAILKVP